MRVSIFSVNRMVVITRIPVYIKKFCGIKQKYRVDFCCSNSKIKIYIGVRSNSNSVVLAYGTEIGIFVIIVIK